MIILEFKSKIRLQIVSNIFIFIFFSKKLKLGCLVIQSIFFRISCYSENNGGPAFEIFNHVSASFFMVNNENGAARSSEHRQQGPHFKKK